MTAWACFPRRLGTGSSAWGVGKRRTLAFRVSSILAWQGRHMVIAKCMSYKRHRLSWVVGYGTIAS